MGSKEIAIIDYGMGNIYGISQACKKIGFSPVLVSTPEEIEKAENIILPGVGAFKTAMNKLNSSGMSSAIIMHINKGKPLMGICLGFQLLFTSSEEFGETKGLGVFDGNFKKFPNINKENKKVRIPNIGWYKIKLGNLKTWKESPLSGLKDEEDYVYFVHSYYLENNTPHSLSKSSYMGIEYSSSVYKNNVFGTQFHPEKSGKLGLRIMMNFFN